MAREFQTGNCGKPNRFRDHFSDKGRVRAAYGSGWSFQIARHRDGKVWIWTVGPLEGWHDFQEIAPGTPFDDALFRTGLPGHLGWRR